MVSFKITIDVPKIQEVTRYIKYHRIIELHATAVLSKVGLVIYFKSLNYISNKECTLPLINFALKYSSYNKQHRMVLRTTKYN